MHVSTAKVLRRFAQKFASVSPELDKLETAQLEAKPAKQPAKVQGPQEAPRTGMAGKSTDRILNAVEEATRKPSLMHSALSGIDSAVGSAQDMGKSLGGLMMSSPGVSAVGAGLGGVGLYGLARLLQSEESRKKRRPVLAPALGAVGGAVALPALIAALSGNKTPAAAATSEKAPAGGLPVVHETHHV